MKLAQYHEIIAQINKFNCRNCVNDLLKEFPDVSENTMYAIVFQEYQRKMQKTKKVHLIKDKIKEYYERYCESSKCEKPGFLLRLADEADLSPSLMAKLILEEHYRSEDPEIKPNVLRENVEKHIKDTSLIKNGQLAFEIVQCHRDDQFYGPMMDVIRSTLGAEYEVKLKQKLLSLGVSFLDEEALRSKGFDKTPDIKLEVPIAIDGRIVNWIESKASFGDVERHTKYLKEQYLKYKNRFGPGLVIYWFGFIEELNTRKKLLISDHMPEDVLVMKVSQCDDGQRTGVAEENSQSSEEEGT